MTAALRSFIGRRRSAPYRYDDINVMPATSKVEFGVARRGGIAHRISDLAVAFIDGRAHFGARWLCGSGTTNAVLLKSPDVGAICPRCEERTTPAVYRCFDAAGQLLYIGCTIEPTARFRTHERDSWWWPEVADIRLETFADITAAHFAEARAIGAEDPPYNYQLRRPAQPQRRSA